MNDTKVRPAISIISYGIVLAYCSAASSTTFGDFAPLPLTVTWLYVASFAAGLAMALMYSEAKAVFGGTALIAFVAALVFGGALALAVLRADPRLTDVVGLYVFQQVFPRILSISVFGLSGAFLGTVARHMLGIA